MLIRACYCNTGDAFKLQLDHPIHTEKITQRQSTYLHERWLDAIPGIILILSSLLTLFGAFLFPLMAMRAAAVFTLYSIIRFLLAAIAHVRGLEQIKAMEQRSLRESAVRDVYHIIIIPNYNEPEHILHRSLTRLAEWGHAPERMLVILAMEQHEPHAWLKAQSLMSAFKGCFAHLTYTLHPNDLPGEMRCKSSNLSWAVHFADTSLVAGFHLDPSKVIVTTMDADTLWHPHYFDALGEQFCHSDAPYARIWQAPIRYHANIYDVHPALRLANVYSTAMELAYLSAAWWPSMPISSYSLSLNLLRRMNFWETNVIADEWHTYIKGYFVTKGQLKTEPVYLPFSVNAVTGKTFLSAIMNRYRQTLRHSWGSKEIGYTLHQMTEHRNVPGWRVLLSVGHDLIQGTSGAALLAFGSQLPLLIHPDLRAHILANFWEYPAFIILQLTFVITLILSAMFLYLDIRERPPRPKPLTHKERLQVIMGFLLLPFYGVAFVILPLIHAQLLLLLGRKLTFEVTAKE